MARSYIVGESEVRPDERRVMTKGQPAALGARAFDLLMCLIEHRDRVVTKDELMAWIWPGLVVEENNLTVQISALRKLLGAQSVATVPGRGYRLVAEVREASGDAHEVAPGRATGIEMPDRPCIAVLPFANMSGDPQQEYFCDGITEDIITGLAMYRWFPVIDRSSTFVYKDRRMDARRIANELGARFILEGSVRRADERIRVNVQLIDAETAYHVWAETYDRDLADIFAVQDDITERVVGNLEPQILLLAEAERRRRKRTGEMTALDSMYQGIWHFYRITKADMAEARKCLQRSVELDPDNASQPLGWLAGVNFLSALLGMTDDPRATLTAAAEAAQRSVALDDQDFSGHTVLGLCLVWARQFERGTSELERGVELNPSSAFAHVLAANGLEFAGRPADAVAHSRFALKLSPRDPLLTFFFSNLGLAHFMLHELHEAAEYQKKALSLNPANLRALHRLASAQAHLGQVDEARATFQASLKLMPSANVAFIDATYPFRKPEDRAFFLDGLHSAGLPE